MHPKSRRHFIQSVGAASIVTAGSALLPGLAVAQQAGARPSKPLRNSLV